MQSEILDIVIIGCLVLLFGSTYRKRPSRVVRAWLLGWILILIHFAALLFHPAGPAAANTLSAIGLSALLGCGIVFLAAPPREQQPSHREAILTLGLAAIGILACVVIASWDANAPSACLAAGSLTAGALLVYAFRLGGLSLPVRVMLLLAVAATAAWCDWGILHGQLEIMIVALLTQVYLLVGITYIGTVRRISAGTLTVSLGLVAWAAVFPVSEWLQHLGLAARLHPEFWNVPKYFVAFGMMLMLLEEEILAANAAGQTLAFQASHDQLTGLCNRASLEQVWRTAVEAAREQSRHCALICFDLDRFKHINDTYGHGIGDTCLRVTGARLARLASDRHTSGRIGGEEFGVVLSDFAEAREAEAAARRIQSALKQPIQAEGYVIDITVSIGIAVFPENGTDPAELWRHTDAAMYRAKKTGGNQVVSMSPGLVQLTTEANDMERLLRHALREGGLELQFQPVFEAQGQLHSVEALVRLRHPELGLVLPGRFISIAEERGLIVPLGDWVFKQVCTQLAAWQRRGIPPVTVAINISALQITSSNFATDSLELIAAFGLHPSLLAMEITETAVLRNVGEAARQIDILAAAGISFSVDDFGVGYSSLAKLHELEVDYLKIDRSFVSRMEAGAEARSIVSAIISMAHSLELKVIAEGVEDQVTLDRLAGMGCDLFQGFFLDHPLRPEELEQLLGSLKHSETAQKPKSTARPFAARS